MSAVAAKPAAGGAMNPTAMAVGVVMLLILLGIGYVVSPMVLTYAPTVSRRLPSWHSSALSSAVS